MSIAQFIRILLARRVLIALCVAAALFAGAAASIFLPQRYEGRARLILDIIRPDPVTGTIIATQFLRAYTRTQIQLIQDPRTTGRVVDQLGWTNDPEKIEAYQKAGVAGTVDLRRWLADSISSNTDAAMLETSNILEIVYTGRSPAEAQRIAGLLRDTFITESLELRQEGARRTARWYMDQARAALARLTAAENARSAFARENGIVLTGDNLDLETMRLNSLTQQAAAAASATSPGVIPQANPLQGQLDQLDQQIALAARNLGPNHPQLQALQAQRSALAASVARAGSGRAIASGPDFGKVQREFEMAKSRVMNQRAAMDRLQQMQGEIEVQRGQYQKTAQRAADLQLEGDVSEAGMQPLGTAIAPDSAAFPNRPLIMAASLIGGLVVGLVLALGLELVKRRVRGNMDLEQAGEVAVMAVIEQRQAPHSLPDRIGGLLRGPFGRPDRGMQN